MFSKTENDAKFEAFRAKHSSQSLTVLVAACSARSATGGAQHRLSPAAIKLARGILDQIGASAEIDLDLDQEALLVLFVRPGDAVKFSILLRSNLRGIAEESAQKAFDQIGIHSWKVHGPELSAGAPVAHDFAREVKICVGLIQIAAPHQTLLTPDAFESARQTLRREDFGKVGALNWLNHGPYNLASISHQTEVCEVGETGASSLSPPANSDHAQRTASEEEPLVWGWRPGPGASVPGTRCLVETRLADSRFGEVWAAVDTMVKEKKMFKFCFRKDWAHALKEAEPALLLVKKKLSQDRNVLAIQATSLDQPPYYIQCELFEGKDLHAWCHDRGGVGAVQFSSRLELMAQAASALQAAHEAKILHQDIRPENILVFGTGESARHVQVKLTDFQTSHIGLQVPYEEEVSEPEPVAVAVAPPGSPKSPPVPEAPVEQAPAPPGDPYLAPELLEGKPPSPKTDIYAMGVVLAQLVLGRFTNSLQPERLKEVLAAVKRPDLIPVVAEKPEERADSASLLVRELRTAVKERDSRTHAHQTVTPRVLARNIAIGVLAVIALILLAQEIPEWWKGSSDQKPKAAEAKKAATKPAEVRTSQSDSRDLALKDTPSENESGNTVVQVGGEHKATVGSVKKGVEEPRTLGSGAVKFFVIPLIAVIALGYGLPRLYQMVHHKKR